MILSHASRLFGTKLLNALFPPQCLRCDALLMAHGSVCNDCWQDLHFVTKPMCARCSHPFEYDLGEDALCGACIQELPIYDSAFSALVFDDTSKALLHKLKFEDQTYLAPTFASWLVPHLQNKPPLDVVIPVPLSRKRLWKRRYNQSALVAKQLAGTLDMDFNPCILRRIKHTLPQTGLTKTQRQDNVQGAFTVPASHIDHIQGKKILLVDDVMTTGATIDACSKTLKKAGAGEVHVITLARVIRAQ